MADMPESALALLTVLVEIEDQAVEVARMKGCKCSGPYGDTGRDYPLARFEMAECIGKLPNQIPWKIAHQPGCLMDGQEGIGYASHGPKHARAPEDGDGSHGA
jgi:hypothetical protein